MTRLTVVLLLAMSQPSPGQNPYAPESSMPRPVPAGATPARGQAGGVIDTRPRFDFRPEIEISPRIQMTPSYSGAAGGYSLATAPFFPAPYIQDPMNGYLTGIASVTQATGQYWNDIQQARLTREEARRSTYDTARKQVEFEMWYERQKPKTQDLVDAAIRTDLERARRDPPQTEIWSGQALNALMNNILKHPSPTVGPRITLSEDVVRGLNLIDPSSRGNLSMAKEEGRINWPEGLQEEAFDGPRDRFTKNFSMAMSAISAGDGPSPKVLRELRADLKEMENRLNDLVETLTPGQFLSGRRVINQLRDQVTGMSDPAVISLSRSWRNDVKTVGDLVGVFKNKGLKFGPAIAPGDERMYNVAYMAVRNYERELMSLASR